MKNVLFSFVFLMLSMSIFAQDDVSFHLIVPDTVPLGETFKITFQLDNARGTGFDIAEWKNFIVVSGPQTSSSYSIINGVSSQEMTYTYYIQAKEEGTFTINPATVFVDGKALKTDWKKIVVQEGYVQKNRTDRIGDLLRNKMPYGSGTNPRGTKPPKPAKKKRTNKKTYRI